MLHLGMFVILVIVQDMYTVTEQDMTELDNWCDSWYAIEMYKYTMKHYFIITPFDIFKVLFMSSVLVIYSICEMYAFSQTDIYFLW